MTGHIYIIFTMTILGINIFHYYSSNSITSNYIVFTGVKNFCLRSVAHARASVGSGRPQSADVCLVIQTCSFDACVCGAVYAFSRIFSPFSLSKRYYIVQYGRKKIRFRDVATASCTAAILHRCCGHVSSSTSVPGISVYIFSCNCTV